MLLKFNPLLLQMLFYLFFLHEASWCFMRPHRCSDPYSIIVSGCLPNTVWVYRMAVARVSMMYGGRQVSILPPYTQHLTWWYYHTIPGNNNSHAFRVIPCHKHLSLKFHYPSSCIFLTWSQRCILTYLPDGW